MKYSHLVNHNGIYYKAGEEVPVDTENKTEVVPVSGTSKTTKKKAEQKGE